VYRVEISPATDRDLEKLKARIRTQDFERLRDAMRSLAHRTLAPGESGFIEFVEFIWFCPHARGENAGNKT
jgi:mRNA-degrading endonuclease RelE of RelBE toxin-antitoxin system